MCTIYSDTCGKEIDYPQKLTHEGRSIGESYKIELRLGDIIVLGDQESDGTYRVNKRTLGYGITYRTANTCVTELVLLIQIS